MSQRVEIVSNIEPKKFGLNVRRYGSQPSIFVRSFSPITSRRVGRFSRASCNTGFHLLFSSVRFGSG